MTGPQSSDLGLGPFGAAFRGIRIIINARGVPAEMASADRLVAAADDADIALMGVKLACRDTLASMDAFMEAMFEGLTEEEALEMLTDDSMQTIMGARDAIAKVNATAGPDA